MATFVLLKIFGYGDAEKGVRTMNRVFLALLAATLISCSPAGQKSADVEPAIRNSLNQAGLENVSLSQDRDKGVVKLSGRVATEADKERAESIAKGQAAGQVVANEIEVVPPAAEHDAKAINEDLDKSIEKDLDASLTRNGMRRSVKDSVTNGVVTLTGNVPSQKERTRVEKIASEVPHVKQVVNKLDVKNQKATSRSGAGN
jgi:osmotically-inducible protein OsmY